MEKRPRQRQRRSHAARRGTIERNRSAVGFGEVPHDREAETRSRQRFVGTNAALQHALPQPA